MSSCSTGIEVAGTQSRVSGTLHGDDLRRSSDPLLPVQETVQLNACSLTHPFFPVILQQGDLPNRYEINSTAFPLASILLSTASVIGL